jgi:hypothetical protein
MPQRLPELALARLLGRGTALATAVVAVGAVLWWTPWHPAAAPVVLTGAALFAALPVAGLVLLAVRHFRTRDLVYAGLATLVLAVVLADTVVGGLLP